MLSSETMLMLLQELQKDCEKPLRDLSRVLRVSFPRISLLRAEARRKGKIVHCVAVLDPQKMGFAISAFLFLGLTDQRNIEEVANDIERFSFVQQVHTTYGNGEYNLIVKICGRTTDDITQAEKYLLTIPRVVWRQTCI